MIPLHVHSNNSLLSGTFSLDDLLSFSEKQNVNSLALTDTNGMYGLIQFFKKCKESKIKPIAGAYLDEPENPEVNAVILAKNNNGYKDICKLITIRKLNDDFSLFNVFQNIWNDIVIISSSLELLKNINLKNDIYAEIIITKKNKISARTLYQFAIENKISIVASNPVYFLHKEDFDLHKILTAIRLNKSVNDLKDNEIVDEEFYFKTDIEMKKVFGKIPEALNNQEKIASICDVDLSLNEYKYPKFPYLNDETSESKFLEVVYEGFNRKYPKAEAIERKRLQYEIDVIIKLNFSDYFLIVWDMIEEAKRRGMLLIGRGSAANSLVAYCMDITQVDPIQHNLYFERFLNKARSNPPDIDIDFSWKERDEIVKYIFERYGYERVAMISTHVTFRAKSAFREVAKAYGFSEREVSAISKKIPWTSAENLPNISELFPEARNLNLNIEPWASIIKYAAKLAKYPRHLSIHPSGIVITPTKITDYCALEYAKNKGLGLIITQPDMYSIEDLGLIKIDILSQRSLGVLRDTISTIKLNSEKKN